MNMTMTTNPRGSVPTMPAPKSTISLPYLRGWRLERLLTQVQLAQAAGVSEPTIVRAENGAPVHALTAVRLARALSVTVRQLQEEEPAQ